MRLFQKYLSLTTAVSLFLQQISPLYAMEQDPEEEKNQSKSLSIFTKSKKKKDPNNNNEVSDEEGFSKETSLQLASLTPEEDFLGKEEKGLQKQLSQRWQIPASLLDAPLVQFQSQVLGVIQGEEDQLAPLLREASSISLFWEEFQNPKSSFLKWPSELTLPQHESNFLMKSTIDLSHAFLKPIQTLLQKLDSFKEHPVHGSLSQRLHKAYTAFISDSSLKTPADLLKKLRRVQIRSEQSKSILTSNELADTLLSSDERGITTRENKSGSSPVKGVGEVYFKRPVLLSHVNVSSRYSTLDPGLEWGVYALNHLLVGQGIIPSSLLIFNHVPRYVPLPGTSAAQQYEEIQDPKLAGTDRVKYIQELQEKPHEFKRQFLSYAVQATKAVTGTFLSTYVQETLSKKQTLSFDEESFSAHVLNALLMKPSDYKGDNLMVTPGGKIVAFDNDWALSFMIGVVQEKHFAGFRDFLFCLKEPMEKPIHPKIREKILSHTPEVFVLEWLGNLKAQNYRYMRLFVDQDISSDLYHQIHLPIKFHPETLPELLKDFKEMQNHLRESSFLTHQELFERIFPLLSAYYKVHRDKKADKPWIGFEELYKRYNPIEDTLSLTQKLSNGKTVGEELKFHAKGIEEYRQRTLPIEDAVSEYFRTIPWEKLPYDHFRDILEQGVKYFPHQTKENLHPLFLNRVLSYKPSPDKPLSFELFTFLFTHIKTWEQDEDGQTPLHKAIQFNPEVIPLLLKHLPDIKLIEVQDKKGLTVLDLAMTLKAHSSVEKLIQKGAGSNLNPDIALKYYKAYKAQNPNKSQNLSIFDPLYERNMSFAWQVALEEILPPTEGSKEKGLQIRGATLGERVIPEALISELLDSKGNIINKTSRGRHAVGVLKKGSQTLYFKEYPELPGFEEAVGSLSRGLFGNLTPYVELFRIKDKPVLVSWGVPGDALEEGLLTSPLSLEFVNPEQLIALTLLAFLTNPEDGKPDNLKIWKDQIYSIDNDHSFVPAVAKEQKIGLLGREPVIQVKTMLYCMNNMKKSVPASLREKLISYDMGEILEEWLRDLRPRAQQYHELFPQKERIQLLDKHQSHIGIPFQQGGIERLYDKALRLQDIIAQNPEKSLFEILKDLEPHLAKRYNPIVQKEALQAFKKKIQEIHQKKQTPFTEDCLRASDLVEKKLTNSKEALHLQEAFTAEETPYHVYIKFLFIDGDFYLKNTKGGHDTLSTSQHILKSQSIPLKESLMDQAKQVKQATTEDPTYGPNMALQALKKARTQRSQLGETSFSDIKLDTYFMKRLREADFSKVGIEQQRAAFRAMKGRTLPNVYLVNAQALTDSLLTSNISLSYLKELDLRGTPQIQGQLFSILEKEAPQIEYINLANSGIRVVGNRGLFTTTLVHFPSLKGLNANDSKNLQEIHLKAPQLTWIEAAFCINLQKFKLKSDPQKVNLEGSVRLLKEDIENIILNNQKNLYFNIKGTKSPEAYLKALEILEGKEDKEKINLSDEKISDLEMRWVVVLLKNKSPKELNLSWNNVGVEGANAISSGNFSQLQKLDLRNNKMRDEGVKALSSGNFSQLKVLILQDNKVGNEGVKALSAGNFSQLQELDLSNWIEHSENKIGTEGVKALTNGVLSQLQILNLRNNEVGDEGAKALANGNLSQLRVLKLHGNGVGDEGAQSLATGNLCQLQWLDLDLNNVGDGGTKFLATGNFSQLQQLVLWSNNVGVEGAKALANGNLSQLRELDLFNNNVGDEGVKALANGNLCQLQWLDLEWNSVSYETKQFIRSRLPKTKIEF